MSHISFSVRWGNVLLASTLSGALALGGAERAAASTLAGTTLTSAAQLVYSDDVSRTVVSPPVTLIVARKPAAAVALPVSSAVVTGTQAYPCTLTNAGNYPNGLRITVTMTSNTYASLVIDANGDGAWQNGETTMLRSVPSLEPGESVRCFLLVRAMPGTKAGATGGVTVFAAPADELELRAWAGFTPTFAVPKLWPKFMFEGPEPIVSPPTVRNGLALAGTASGVLYAVRTQGAEAGTLAWRFPTAGSLGAPIIGRVASDGGFYYVAANNGILYKLDAGGQPIWDVQAAPAGTPMEAMPILSGPKVILACGDGRVRHIDKQTGDVLSISDSVGSGVLSTPSMPGADDLWVGGSDGYLYNMKADESFTIQSAYPISHGPMSATPFVDSRRGVVVTVSEEGNVYAMKVRSNQMVWGPIALGSPVKSSPYVHTAAGIAYLTTTDGSLHALNMADGSPVAGYPVRLSETGEIAGSPVVVPMGEQTTVFAGSMAGSFFAVNAAAPQRVARFDTGDPTAQFVGSPAVSGPTLDDVVVAAATNGKLYGFLMQEAVAAP